MTPDSDDDVIIISPPKKIKMEFSNRVNSTAGIRIEQLVKHDTWDIQKKNDGAFVMKKLHDNRVPSVGASNSGRSANVDITWVNPEQSGARPKAPRNNIFTINAVNAPKDKVIAVNCASVPKSEVHVPKTTNSVITLNPVNTTKSGFISVHTVTPPVQEITINSAPANAPASGVITINPHPLPKENVLTLTMPAARKKGGITMKTTATSNMEVFTINTAKSSKQNEAAGSQARVKLKAQRKNIQSNEGQQGFAMTLDPASGTSPSSSNVFSSYASESTPLYTDEACRIQEMFPAVPLNAISNDLMITGSMETTIDNLLPGVSQLSPSSSTASVAWQNLRGGLQPSSNAASSSESSVVHSNKEVVSEQSTKMEKVPNTKKASTLIKIELLAQNEVWDIKKKDNQGYVMRKVVQDDSQSETDKPDNDFSLTDNLAEPMEEESDYLLSTDDILNDGMPYKADSIEVGAPLKLMTLSSKCSGKNSADPGRRILTDPSEEKMESSGQTLCSGDEVPMESFDFSDDENEEDETTEHFLFKASLVLKKLKFLNEAKDQNPSDSALLNITGVVRNEEENESTITEESCPINEERNDSTVVEGCPTNEEENESAVAEEGSPVEDDDDEYYTDCSTDSEEC